MPSILWHWRGRKDRSRRSTRNTDLETQDTLSVALTRTIDLNAIIAQGSVQDSPRRPTVPATGESHTRPDLWRQAMTTLSEADRASIARATSDTSMPAHKVVDTMIILVTERQQQCENRGWKKLHLNDYEISLGDLASNAIIWLNKFKEIGDIIVQYDPAHAALPWVAARFLLQASVATEEQMAACLTITEKVVRIIHRCQVFEGLYNRETVDHVVAESLESALVKLYASVLRGLIETNKFLSKRTAARSLCAIFHPTASSGLLTTLENDEAQVRREIIATGSGKTYLTSRIIEEIEKVLITKGSDESFAFFYCNRNEENRRNALSILRSYVRQLSTTPHRLGFMHPHLKQLHADSQLIASGWTLGLCQEYLIKLIKLYPGTVLVLDALDECGPEERTSLLDFFDSIPSQTSKPVRIFLSSRPEGDIRQRLIHIPSIEIQATDNEHDIAKFVTQNIEKHGRWSDTLKRNQPLKNKIVNTLLDQSKGMFQWAALQINQLLDLRTEPEILMRLGKLPRGLEAAYDEIFENIENLDTPAGTLSLRPTEADILDWCANLVRIDSQQNPPVWRVSHLSVVEYLEARWGLLEADCFVAKACLVLLLQEKNGLEPEDENGPDGIFHPDHQIQIYVRYHWIGHAKTQEGRDVDLKLTDLLKTFLGSLESSSAQYENWHRRARHDWLDKPSSSPFCDVKDGEISPGSSTIFLVCRFSLYTLLHGWWDTVPIGVLSQLAYSGDDLLALAAQSGCKPICIKLCEAGIPVNRPLQKGKRGHDHGNDYGSALAAAIYSGSLEIVQLLIDNGADINMPIQTGRNGSALILRDNGAHIDMPLRAGDYGSALEAAVCGGSLEIIRLLIDNGADINMPLRNGDHGSALVAAIYEESLEIIRLLIDKGADVNILVEPEDHNSPLVAAIYRESAEITRLLIDNGANVNIQIQNRGRGSALIAAIYGGSLEIIQLLIDNGAEINSPVQAGDFASALVAAIYKANTGIVQLLIDRGGHILICSFTVEPIAVLLRPRYTLRGCAASAGQWRGH
ncbi:hypothetical protein EKO27_g11040 [Xylaria grammica]|uniref:Uncharacterized protein n=1 Tax=Xylaria grammica TaxID=363999 RepID=A0A439CPI7_9PEZI|nr:hypothetical protein EKO27_g11040 [Xylaria grammica]